MWTENAVFREDLEKLADLRCIPWDALTDKRVFVRVLCRTCNVRCDKAALDKLGGAVCAESNCFRHLALRFCCKGRNTCKGREAKCACGEQCG